MKQMKVSIYILVTAFILSSCSIQKRCQAPELNLPDEIIAGENDTLTIADMSWWELYSDSTLSKLIKKTLRNNRNMQAAEAHIKQMEELYRVSKASRWPTIGAQLFADHETNDYYGEKFSKSPEFSLKASLGWEIDLWGSQSSRYRYRRIFRYDCGNYRRYYFCSPSFRMGLQVKI